MRESEGEISGELFSSAGVPARPRSCDSLSALPKSLSSIKISITYLNEKKEINGGRK